MNCKNCKHYLPIGQFSGECHADKVKIGYPIKFVDYKIVDNVNTIKPDQAMVLSDDSLSLTFCVGEDFGCVHFKKQ